VGRGMVAAALSLVSYCFSVGRLTIGIACKSMG
jgi:hypothetical protein